jgi:hypothetical protein
VAWQDELALIESVLKGYPNSIAKADALRAVRVLQATLPAAPTVQEPVAWLYPEGLEALQNGKCWTAYPTKHDGCNIPLCAPSAAQPAVLEGWIAVSDRLPLEDDGEVLVLMRDGRHEIAWATYWHGASNAFAQWTFRDPDEDETPTHWMKIAAAPEKGGEA